MARPYTGTLAYLWEGSVQPLHGVDLDPTDPNRPMQVGTGCTSCITTEADHLARLYHVTRLDQDLGEVIIRRIDSPTMVDDNDSTSHNELVRVHDFTWRGCIQLRSKLATEIQAAVK